jgi:hypothetical protein
MGWAEVVSAERAEDEGLGRKRRFGVRDGAGDPA